MTLIEGVEYEVTFTKYDECGGEFITTQMLKFENGKFEHPSGKEGTYVLGDPFDELPLN